MLLFFSCLVFIAGKGVISKKFESTFMEYDSLASAVQSTFASSSVLIVNAGLYEDLTETALMAKMTRELSNKAVFSQYINFPKLHGGVKHCTGKTVRPLFVIMLKTMDDVHRFAEITKLYNMALHTWLVIFMHSMAQSVNLYCNQPRENLFNLVVSTKMIVKCGNDTSLKEWYSVDEETVDTFDYGNWSINEKRVIKFMENGHFYERRSNFKGARLKVSAVKERTPLPNGNSTVDCFFGQVLKELSNLMNFTYELNSIEPTYGSYNESSRRWDGVVGKLVDRKIDIGIGEFSLTRQRVAVIDFTIPLLLTSSYIYVKRPDMTNVDWSAYVKAFQKDIWLIIITTLILTPIFLTIMWKVIKGYHVGYRLIEEYLSVWGIYCQKPLTDFPRASSLRLAYISIFASSLVLFAVYSAHLTSSLTYFKPSLPFDTLEGFIHDGTYKLVVIRQSSHHDLVKRNDTSIFYDMGKLMKSDSELPFDMFDVFKQVCNERTVFFGNQLLIEKVASYAPCELTPLTRVRLDHASLTLVKDSPYTEIFNHNLKRLRALGITERLKRRYFKKYVVQQLTYLPVVFGEIIPVLGALGLGLTIALQLLICELIVHGKQKKQSVGGIGTKSHSVKGSMAKA